MDECKVELKYLSKGEKLLPGGGPWRVTVSDTSLHTRCALASLARSFQLSTSWRFIDLKAYSPPRGDQAESNTLLRRFLNTRENMSACDKKPRLNMVINTLNHGLITLRTPFGEYMFLYVLILWSSSKSLECCFSHGAHSDGI